MALGGVFHTQSRRATALDGAFHNHSRLAMALDGAFHTHSCRAMALAVVFTFIRGELWQTLDGVFHTHSRRAMVLDGVFHTYSIPLTEVQTGHFFFLNPESSSFISSGCWAELGLRKLVP